jgi:hypothetical protein
VNNNKKPDIMKKITNDKKENAPLITRKQAIQKAGITALTAATVLFLSTKQSAAASNSPDNPGGGWG